jgi:hypothetical protein
MKANILFLLVIPLFLSCSQAQTSQTIRPRWNASITVVDEATQPVAGADVEVSYYVQPLPNHSEAGESTHGLTDTNGFFAASHEDSGSANLGFRATKAGYYPTTRAHEFSKFSDTDSTKWNPNATLVLKKIGKPSAMYAKSVINLKFPAFNKPIGYDLAKGDWVSPYGNGTSVDILLRKEYQEKTANDYYSKITLTFPKAGDGVQVYTIPDAESGSALRSPHEAPTDGFQRELAREVSAHPGQPSKFEYDANRIYLFRVRTVMDEKGTIKSALYGKIYGDLTQFSYYLNRTPNDRNLEFDSTRNLLSGLQPVEQVSAP